MFQRVLVLAPYLRRGHHICGGKTYLIGGGEPLIINHNAVQVLDLLDGRRTVEQVLGARADLAPSVMLDTLVQLESQGIIVEREVGDADRAVFSSAMGLEAAPGFHAAVIDASVGDDDARVVRGALAGAGLQIGDEPGPGCVSVLVADDYLSRSCIEAAVEEWRVRRPCFLIKPSGLRPLIGPLLWPGDGRPCIRCLTHALMRQRPVEHLLHRDAPTGPWPSPPRVAFSPSVAAAANLAAIELVKSLGARGGTQPRPLLWSLDIMRFELEGHEVVRRPQCAECGDSSLMARRGERAVSLDSVPVGYRADGGFRRESPSETYARLRHLVSPVLGPVTHLRPMQGRHSEARPVFSSSYFVVPRDTSAPGGFARRCAGKGRTSEQARVGALAEAIERLSGTYQGDEAVKQASVAQLGGSAIDPARLHLFSSSQSTRAGVEPTRDSPPPMLEPHVEIAWTPGWSLTDDCRRYLPLAYCYSNAPVDCGAAYCRPSSNGSAAGTCFEEAILQGLFEAVERDAVSIWWYGRIRRPSVAIPPTLAPYFDALRAEYEAHGWRIWLLDLTHDLGLPVVTAVAAHEPSDRFALGLGCHQDSCLAISRALTELNQVFDPEGSTMSPWEGMSISQLTYLHPDRTAPSCVPAPPVASADLRELVMTWVGRLRERGLETIVVDKSRPDLELNVVQVVVPGLRHIWPRFGPGRLYTVPVALGWCSEASREEQLNPLPLLL